MPSSRPNISAEDLPSLQEIAGKGWVSLEQAANIIGVSYQTVLKYVKPVDESTPAKLKAVRVGGQYRIYEEALRSFLATGQSE
jgi:excisionase family DNA binding protein